MQGRFEGEEVLGRRDDAGEVHEVHLQEVDVGCRVRFLDLGDGCCALLWGSGAHVKVGVVFC